MKCIGIVANFEKEQACASVRNVIKTATTLGFEIFVEENAAALVNADRVCPIANFKQKGVEAVLVLGGDGTLLDAAHRLAGQQLPLMGLNIGSLGYLTSVEERQFEEALKQLSADFYAVSPRTALAITLVHRREGTTQVLPDALNDVVVSRASGRAVELDLLLDDQPVTRVLCDGIIVSTPTGSTAYSLSAGGPILLPDTPALVISTICPHTLTSRPLVIRDTVKVTLQGVVCATPMIVSSDGRDDLLMQQEDCVHIVRSPRSVLLMELNDYNPCDVMRRKLRWGGR